MLVFIQFGFRILELRVHLSQGHLKALHLLLLLSELLLLLRLGLLPCLALLAIRIEEVLLGRGQLSAHRPVHN